MSIVSTHLIVDDGVPDVVRHCGHGLDVVLTLLVAAVDAIAERSTVIPNQPKSARRASTRRWIRVDSDYSLEKLRPMLMLVCNPESIVTALL